MKTVDERSLKVLTDWNGGKYKCEGQKEAVLHALINSALKEQGEITSSEIEKGLIDALINSDFHPEYYMEVIREYFVDNV